MSESEDQAESSYSPTKTSRTPAVYKRVASDDVNPETRIPRWVADHNSEDRTSDDESYTDHPYTDSDEGSVDRLRLDRATMRRDRHQQFSVFSILVFMVWQMNLVVAMADYSPQQPQENRIGPAAIDHTALTNFVSRSTWDYRNDFHQATKRCGAKHVAIIQSDTELCEVPENCEQLLYEIERETGQLPYNFVLTPDGYIYEVLGWNEPSPMFLEVPTMVVAFLGNYANNMPTDYQLDQLRALLAKAEEIQFLASDYIMFGKKTKEVPVKLFECLAPWSQWDFEKSDIDEVYTDNGPYYVVQI